MNKLIQIAQQILKVADSADGVSVAAGARRVGPSARGVEAVRDDFSS